MKNFNRRSAHGRHGSKRREQFTSDWRLQRSEVFIILRRYHLRPAKPMTYYHIIDRLEERGWEYAAGDDLPWKDEVGPLSLRPTMEL